MTENANSELFMCTKVDKNFYAHGKVLKSVSHFESLALLHTTGWKK